MRMSCCSSVFSLKPKLLPCCPSSPNSISSSSSFKSKLLKQFNNPTFICMKHAADNWISKPGIQLGTILATVTIEQPALALTGELSHFDLIPSLIQGGIIAVLYFLIVPPFLMNWLRIRWYRRNLLEMYVQFMFVFLFFPGVLLWAPFINFRKFPRDPDMKYPWSTPKDPSLIKNDYLKYPWAKPEDYDLF